jgi:23S rRNA (guanosine2251-2'-O)-methyltransferase
MNKSTFFIVGQHAVIEALKNPKRKVLRVFLTEESKKNIHRKSQKKNLLEDVKVYFKTKKELDKYSTKENLLHQGYVAEIEHLEKILLKEFIKEKNNITFACLDGVTDPRNIGSLIRSAASFDIDGILIKERNFPNESKLMYKAASGAIEYINIFEVSNINSTLKNLKDKNFWVYGFDGNGKKNFTDMEWKGNKILVFGSEGFGMHQHTSKYADFLVKIDISKKVESLNISNSAAIVFHHLSYLKKRVD